MNRRKGWFVKVIRSVAVVGAVGVLAGACGQRGCLEVIGSEAQVLEHPYPLDYPSSDPKPNAVITALSVGTQIEWDDIEDGKDYRAYRVEIDGQFGYVLFDSNVISCSE